MSPTKCKGVFFVNIKHALAHHRWNAVINKLAFVKEATVNLVVISAYVVDWFFPGELDNWYIGSFKPCITRKFNKYNQNQTRQGLSGD